MFPARDDALEKVIITRIFFFLKKRRYTSKLAGENCGKIQLVFPHSSARNGKLEVPVYFLKSKQGNTVRKMEKQINGYNIC
jgi:hypothetical protein